jgi:hypothetical protein
LNCHSERREEPAFVGTARIAPTDSPRPIRLCHRGNHIIKVSLGFALLTAARTLVRKPFKETHVRTQPSSGNSPSPYSH